MYSDEEKSTAIAYRLIHDNLPMFLDNTRSFSRIADSDVKAVFVKSSLLFQNTSMQSIWQKCFNQIYFSETLTQEQIAVYNHVVGGRTLENGTKIQGINEYVNLYNQHKDTVYHC